MALASVIWALVGVSIRMSNGYMNAEATLQRVLTPVTPGNLQKQGNTLCFGIQIIELYCLNSLSKCVSSP